jgi:acetate kinase
VADAIVVLNAGSSSLKFSVFVARGGGLEPDLRGNIEEIDTRRVFRTQEAL